MTVSALGARYRPALIALHWLTLLLLIGVYACIEGREFFPRGSALREGLKTWHFMLGLTVFGVVWLRLLLRLFSVTPPIEPPLPRWQTLLSRAVHIALYAVLIGMPLGGWLILSAAGKPIPFFGLELPALVMPDKDLAKTVKNLHETVGIAALYLIGLHALAGLFHHYLRRDDTLSRMLPEWGRNEPK
jgi:superoxide oxidase